MTFEYLRRIDRRRALSSLIEQHVARLTERLPCARARGVGVGSALGEFGPRSLRAASCRSDMWMQNQTVLCSLQLTHLRKFTDSVGANADFVLFLYLEGCCTDFF